MAKKLFTQTAITLPVDLKKRMSAVKVDVNWSAVAREAFERKLEEIANQAKGRLNMSSIVERLRESKREKISEARADGIMAGDYWAAKNAKYQQLVNLAEFIEGVVNDSSIRSVENWTKAFTENNAFSPGETLGPIIQGADLTRNGTREFWESAVDDPELRYDNDFVLGFVEGAMGVWEDVKDQL